MQLYMCKILGEEKPDILQQTHFLFLYMQEFNIINITL